MSISTTITWKITDTIRDKSDDEAQNIANQMFINMVTSLPR